MRGKGRRRQRRRQKRTTQTTGEGEELEDDENENDEEQDKRNRTEQNSDPRGPFQPTLHTNPTPTLTNHSSRRETVVARLQNCNEILSLLQNKKHVYRYIF